MGMFRTEADQKKDALCNYINSDLGSELDRTISIPRVFLRAATMHDSKPALMEKAGGAWVGLTFGQLRDRAYAMAASLLDLELPAGGRVAIWMRNCCAWAITDLGTMLAGGVVVPIYQSLAPSIIKFILQDSSVFAIVVEDEACLREIRKIEEELPALKHIIVRVPSEEANDGGRSFDAILREGRQMIPERRQELASRLEGVGRDGLASIIYTSGTTGNPKGVMLSHRNFLAEVYGLLSVTDVDESDVCVSVLPLSHVFERTVGYYAPLFCGATIAYAENVKTFSDNLREVRPTLCCVVPLIMEKMYNRIVEGLRTASPLRQRIFIWALRVGSRAKDLESAAAKGLYSDLRQRHRPENRGWRPPSLLRAPALFLANLVADLLVYRKVRAALGGRLHRFVTGGAAIPKRLVAFYKYLHINIYEGYGLTETSPVVSFNYVGNFKPGTTGKLLPSVQVKFSPEGEILVKGPNVMMGYYNNPQATAEAIDAEGWLHTGDLGEWDEDNYLKITGRIKDLLVLSTGKNVPPIPIEEQLIRSPLISHAVVIGNDRKYVSALIFPDMDALRAIALEHGLSTLAVEEMARHEVIRNSFAQVVEEANKNFSPYEQVKRFELVPYIVEKDPELITPTLKIKRKAIEKRFQGVIEQMYGQ